MKKIGQKKMSQRVGLLCFLAFVFLVSFGCMDPGQYEPEDPPVKTDPPEGPSVLLPVDNTLFYCEYFRWVTLDWTSVEGAEGYEYQVDTDSSFATSYPYLAFPPTVATVNCYPPITTYFFRVRAYSSAWIWYTDWSELIRFHLMPVEDDTIHHWD